MAFGQSGSGKSWLWLMLAEFIHKTKSQSKLYVIDNDMGWDALRPTDGHLDSIVTAFPIYEWDDYKKAVHVIRDKATKDDWFVLDRADKVWDQAQSGYTEKAFGMDVDAFFLQAQIDDVSPGGDYGSNWVQIKRMYGSVVEMIPRFRGHVLGIAAAKGLRVLEEGQKRSRFHDDAETAEKYGRFGFKPAGADKFDHLFFTQLFMVEGKDKWIMNVVTDKGGGRSRALGIEVSETGGFVMSYLVPRAGWKLG